MAQNYGYDWMAPYGNTAGIMPTFGAPTPALPNYQQPIQMARGNGAIIWVQGEIGAKAYPVAPNNTVILMDSETSKFYVKSVDFAGKPSIRTYSYEEVLEEKEAPVEQPKVDYVSRAEFDELKKTIDELMS